MYLDSDESGDYEESGTYVVAIKLDWKPKNLILPLSECEGIVTNIVDINVFEGKVELNTRTNMCVGKDTYSLELEKHFKNKRDYMDDLKLSITERLNVYHQDSMLELAFQCKLKSLSIATEDIDQLCDLIKQKNDLLELKVTLLQPELYKDLNEEELIMNILNSLCNNYVIQHLTIESQRRIKSDKIEQKALDMIYERTGLEIFMRIDNSRLSFKKAFNIASRFTKFEEF